jgi:hypothetical protein
MPQYIRYLPVVFIILLVGGLYQAKSHAAAETILAGEVAVPEGA